MARHCNQPPDAPIVIVTVACAERALPPVTRSGKVSVADAATRADACGALLFGLAGRLNACVCPDLTPACLNLQRPLAVA